MTLADTGPSSGKDGRKDYARSLCKGDLCKAVYSLRQLPCKSHGSCSLLPEESGGQQIITAFKYFCVGYL